MKLASEFLALLGVAAYQHHLRPRPMITSGLHGLHFVGLAIKVLSLD